MKMKGYALLFFLLLNLSNLIYSQNSTKLQIHYNPNGEIILVIDAQFHLDYGCSYPLTYKFELLQNNTQLTAFFRHSKQDNWARIDEKSSSDFFNGIEAVRFDYDSNFVFLSVAFANNKDSTFIKITNNIGNNVSMKFLEVCKYYDNRKAVVTTTADDLRTLSPGFQKAFNAFRSRNLWLSCGVITVSFDSQSIEDIQNQIDSGLVEIDSHSRTHQHPPYDYESEIGGSKDDIINNLDLSPLYKNGDSQYVYAYIYPYGNYNHDIDRTAGVYKYLICRKVTPGEYNFTSWDESFSIYEHVGVVYEVGPLYGGVTDINQLNSTFDDVLSRGEIYHFSIHPNNIETYGDWEKPYMNQHLDYISNRNNVWYVGFGALYLYNLLQESTSKPTNQLALNLLPDTLHITSKSGIIKFNIQSNGNWIIQNPVNWLTLDKYTGAGNDSVTISYESNFDDSARIAKLIISTYNLYDTLTVIQKGRYYFNITALPDSSEAGLVLGSGNFPEGTIDTLKAIPNDGWKFIDWVEDSTVVSTDSVYIFVIDKPRTFIAELHKISTGLDSNDKIVTNFQLFQNYPNPFNPSTVIKYSIPKSSNVKLIIYDILGNQVAELVNEKQPAGNYSYTFNGFNLPSGIYFYRMTTKTFNQTRKLILLK